jgi:hypothetical protein
MKATLKRAASAEPNLTQISMKSQNITRMSRTYTRFVTRYTWYPTKTKLPPEYLVHTYYRVAGKRWALASIN